MNAGAARPFLAAARPFLAAARPFFAAARPFLAAAPLFFRLFPHKPFEEGRGLSLYSNRNLLSLYLFLTWNPSNRWEITLLGNVDFEKDRDLQDLDSWSNLFNFELSYKF